MRIASLIALFIGAVLLGACDTGTPEAPASPPANPTPTATPGPGEQPTPGNTPAGTPSTVPTSRELPADARTGIEGVDAVLAALFGRNDDELASRLRYRDRECTTEPEGLGGPPVCEEGETDGTEVRVFLAAACEGYWTRDAEPVLQSFLEQIDRIYAVAETRAPRPGEADDWLYGDHVIITENTAAGSLMGAGIFIEHGEIVFIWGGCSQDVEQALRDFGGEVLLKASVR